MSFSIANTGLSAVTEQLNTISNNIANSGTKGFKSGRTEFASMYAQSQPLGVGVSGTSQSIKKDGSIDRTGNAMDLAISGNGFFVVKNSSGDEAYTRAGMFTTDKNGVLVNASGMKLQGYPADAAGNVQTGIVSDLKISTVGLPAKATSKLGFMANLPASAKQPTNATFSIGSKDSYNFMSTSTTYDSLGREHLLTQYFVKQAGAGDWKVHYAVDGAANSGAHDLKFDTSGVLTSGNSKTITGGYTPVGADNYGIDITYTGTTQFHAEFLPAPSKSDGYTAGTKNGERIENDGSVYATFSNGKQMLQGKLVLANFANPNGLATQNGTTWSVTSRSGAPLLGSPGTGLLGNIVAGALEASNVDLTAELVGLMTAQRNYQANTKIISTNDSMMNALFQVL
ncbi:TPA: flagellar hook protein FlgE [Yersinia enterocolitica]|uniref:Flagellar hook protein FlgE n=2 Tax=Yersinia enterocolitica TaxID=630 RepID=A0A0H3NKX2_YERE1|nr:flagellar hook protein FlgE [Yersinia enterocolitica]EHB22574.1 flagellar hook protein FlgE [Yersinia enterocolitica subsp. palearctica PhRBD_Ye1]EKN3313426.1 flagellar basal body protein FlgE [Yersinia enterocolitica]EKN3316724.1 flagellar basal body protein FlgE [Yersinia enterocolitica]EKN3320851.1 flagellar basal body protein FlgE [Yersinia enterocolitica]EKN3332701.1 flagellar basal body protein FlgE [Yersinia enterocolitica]